MGMRLFGDRIGRRRLIFLMRMRGRCRLWRGWKNALKKYGKVNINHCSLQGRPCHLRRLFRAKLVTPWLGPLIISTPVNVRIFYVDLPAVEASAIVDRF